MIAKSKVGKALGNIFLEREFDVLVTFPYYIRSHYTARSMNELLPFLKRKYVPVKRNIHTENDRAKVDYSESDFSQREKLFHRWARTLNDMVDSSQKLHWKTVELVSNQNSWEKGGNIPVPSSLFISKSCVLHGDFCDYETDIMRKMISREIKNSSLVTKIRLIDLEMKIWFLDWHSGGFDIKVRFMQDSQPTHDEYLRLSNFVVESFQKYLFHSGSEFAIDFLGKYNSRSNQIGKWMYDAARMQLNGPSDSSAPFKTNHLYLHDYFDFSKSLLFRYSNSKEVNSISTNLAEFEVIMKSLSSKDFSQSNFVSLDNHCLRHFACGYVGCVSLLNVDGPMETCEFEEMQAITLWKLTLHYFSGLSKLNQLQAALQQKLAQRTNHVKFARTREVDRFAEYKLRLLVIINESLYSINADTAFERKVFESYWKALKGDELAAAVRDQIQQTATYIRDRKEEEKSRRSKTLTAWGFILSICFSSAGLGLSYKGVFNPTKCDDGMEYQSIYNLFIAIVGSGIAIAGLFYFLRFLYRRARYRKKW